MKKPLRKKAKLSLNKQLKAERRKYLDARKEVRSLERQLDTTREQMKQTVKVNHHNMGVEKATEVAYLRLNRETEALREENTRIRAGLPVFELPPPVTPLIMQMEAKLLEEEKGPVPALRIMNRIDTSRPLPEQWKALDGATTTTKELTHGQPN